MVHAPHRAEAEEPVRPKSTLYCTECDHASHVDADWRLRLRGDRVVLVCPVCGTSITDRPAISGAPALPRPSTRAVSAWSRFVVATTAVWHEALAVSSSTATAVVRSP